MTGNLPVSGVTALGVDDNGNFGIHSALGASGNGPDDTFFTGSNNVQFGVNSASNNNNVVIGYDARATADGSVAIGAWSSDEGRSGTFSVGATGYTRTISNVSAGELDTDAVNMSQLKAVSAVTNNSIQYDNIGHTSVTLGGIGATSAVALTNVAAGEVSSTSTDAVNGSQLFSIASEIAALNGQVTSIVAAPPVSVPAPATPVDSKYFAANSTGAAASASGLESVAAGGNAFASGTNSVAAGSGAQATGANSVAVGANASATGSNAVALGQGSVASGDNTVSVGNASTGMTRTISNVSPGVNGTDAVNVNQLDGAVSRSLHTAERYADRGISAALAMPNIPVLNVGEKWVGTALGSYGSSAAVGVAVAYQATSHLNVAGGFSEATDGGTPAFKLQAGYRW